MDERAETVVERMGRIFDAKRFSRTAGRIFGFLLLADTPQALDDIASALAVSRASVSTESRRLEAIGLIERTSRPGDRRDYYLVPTLGFRRMIQGHLSRMAEMQQVFEEALAVPQLTEAVRRRVAGYCDVHQFMQAKLTELLDDWNTQEHPIAGLAKKS